MNAEAIATLFKFTYFVLTKNVEGVTHEQSLRAPGPGGNCMNWVLGHILASRNAILKLAGEDPLWSAADAALYARGSEPLVPAHAASARPFESMVTDLARTQERLDAGLARISADALVAPGLPGIPGGSQPAGMQLAILNFHESYHAGQTGILRRLLGLPGMIT